MTNLSPTTNPTAARVDKDDDYRRIVIPPPAPGDLAVVLPDRRRLWITLPSLAPLLSGAAYDEATIQSILRDALDVTKRQNQAQPSPTPAGLSTSAEVARKPRRPSISKMVEQAERAGKPLTSITLPDGTKLNFGKPESVEPENPWLADLPKVTK